jgi:hypothetical protein
LSDLRERGRYSLQISKYAPDRFHRLFNLIARVITSRQARTSTRLVLLRDPNFRLDIWSPQSQTSCRYEDAI